MNLTRLISAVLMVGLVAALPMGLGAQYAEARGVRSDTLSVDQIKPGMKGYGLTVFEGTTPERFEVEVINVLKNFRPQQDLILVKTKHPRLEVAKVVAGMSGSPIYLNDKMVGAYAYGWTFGEEPIAGVTPIKNMLEDLDRPLPKMLDGIPFNLGPHRPSTSTGRPEKSAQLGPASSGNRFAGTPGTYDVAEHVAQLAQGLPAVSSATTSVARPVSTPLLLGGMTPASMKLAEELFAPLGMEPMQAGGGAAAPDANAPKRFVDGGAVGVQLVRGDMSGMGLGTVTRVEGDRLVAFGHPMMNAGVTNMPTAVGNVLWFLASKMRSFKIGMAARSVGAMVADRQASIVVSHKAQAPIIPVAMKIKGAPGAPHTEWNFEVAHDKFAAPSFVGMALGNAMQATAAERQDVSWSAVSKLKVRGYGELTFEDYGVAVGGTPDPRDFVRSNLVSAIGVLLNNPWGPVIIEGVSMEIDLRYSRELMMLRGAQVLDPEVEPGGKARVRITLVPYSGKVVHRVLSIDVPKHAAGQKLSIDISSGYSINRPRASPDSLGELINNLENPTHSPKAMVLSYRSGDAVAFKGRLAENLPPGAMDALRPTTDSVAPQPFRSRAYSETKLDEFVIGTDSVSVQVKKALH